MLRTRATKIAEILTKTNSPSYRGKQILGEIYKNYKFSYSAMTSLPLELRNNLVSEMGDSALTLTKVTESKEEQATKVLFQTTDGCKIEAVLMSFQPNDSRDYVHNSLCISSQVGCALGCTFCTTGKLGFTRNLSVDEITDQILFFLGNGQEINNILFMGMGEPFANPNVFDALKIITSKEGLGFGKRHVSVSTVGIIPGIKRLQQEFPEVKLAFSLHSPFDEQRLELMPITKMYPINDVMLSLKEFVEKTNKRVFIAYILLENVNDSIGHAEELARLIKKQGEKSYLYHVNLIRFHPGQTEKHFNTPSTKRVEIFTKTLDKLGIQNTLRQSFGVGIEGGCGQLAAKIPQAEN